MGSGLAIQQSCLSGLSGLLGPSEIDSIFHGINLFGQFSLFGFLGDLIHFVNGSEFRLAGLELIS